MERGELAKTNPIQGVLLSRYKENLEQADHFAALARAGFDVDARRLYR